MNSFLTGKFWKAFIAGGVAQIVFALSTGVTVHNIVDLVGLAKLIVVSFILGAFHVAWNYYFPTVPQP